MLVYEIISLYYNYKNNKTLPRMKHINKHIICNYRQTWNPSQNPENPYLLTAISAISSLLG